MKYLTTNIFNSKNHFLLNFSNFKNINSTFENEIEKYYPKTSPCYFSNSNYSPDSIFIIETENGDKGVISVLQNKKFTDINFVILFNEALSHLQDYFFGCQEEIKIDISKKSFEDEWYTYKPLLEKFENKMVENGYRFLFCIFD